MIKRRCTIDDKFLLTAISYLVGKLIILISALCFAVRSLYYRQSAIGCPLEGEMGSRQPQPPFQCLP